MTDPNAADGEAARSNIDRQPHAGPVEAEPDVPESPQRTHRRRISEGVRSGEFRSSLPVGVLAQSALGLVAWTYRWYGPDHELTAHEVADGLADLLLTGLGASRVTSG